MRTMLLTSTAALWLGIGAAYADGGAGFTQFSLIEAQMAKPQGRTIPQATPHDGATTFIYSASPRNQGTWLSAPRDVGGSNN